MTSKLPPFDPAKGSPYDLSTYSGRFQHFLDVIDPRTLVKSDEEVKQAAKLVEQFQRGETSSVTNDELWEALKLKQSAMNPGTGQIIPRPFRMSSFLPSNVPIVFGMLAFPGPAGTIFWQVVNATYNSLLNYENRSGATVDMAQVAMNYGLAVSTALGLSFGVRALGSRGKMKQVLDRVPFVVPYVAVSGAGAANIYFTRRMEISDGVPISNENGDVTYGVSKEAGKQGVLKTILTRAVGLPLPVLVLPPLILKALPKPKGTPAAITLELAVITMCLAGALPATIALYPPKLVLDVDTLEPNFRNLVDEKTGQRVKYVYANKGL